MDGRDGGMDAGIRNLSAHRAPATTHGAASCPCDGNACRGSRTSSAIDALVRSLPARKFDAWDILHHLGFRDCRLCEENFATLQWPRFVVCDSCFGCRLSVVVRTCCRRESNRTLGSTYISRSGDHHYRSWSSSHHPDIDHGDQRLFPDAARNADLLQFHRADPPASERRNDIFLQHLLPAISPAPYSNLEKNRPANPPRSIVLCSACGGVGFSRCRCLRKSQPAHRGENPSPHL
jgi:hypothetical protein